MTIGEISNEVVVFVVVVVAAVSVWDALVSCEGFFMYSIAALPLPHRDQSTSVLQDFFLTCHSHTIECC
jgi:hypothetical protein